MSKFWTNLFELWRESTLIQGILTLLLVGSWIALIIMGRNVPQSLDILVGSVVGFYFGNKSVQQVASILRKKDQ